MGSFYVETLSQNDSCATPVRAYRNVVEYRVNWGIAWESAGLLGIAWALLNWRILRTTQ
ncbi:hypothetical protein L218DRAFT_953276 [Marasmius fiardii PR-910]|nr:hypothetical protein L218DRAFT_953276 [Marasmius fiardii PR-910]